MTQEFLTASFSPWNVLDISIITYYYILVCVCVCVCDCENGDVSSGEILFSCQCLG